MSLFTALAVAATLGFGQPASQPSPDAAEPPVTELDEVEVIGQATRDRAEAFIGEVAAPPRGRGLARWDRTVCVGAANMDNRFAQFMIDRVSQRAVEAGLEIGEPGCRPDVMIVASSDAKEMARTLVNDNPSGFRPSRANTDMGSAALRRFQTSDAPVRWWYVSLPVSVDTGEVAVRLDGEDPPSLAVRDASRLRANVRDDLARVMIIVDVSKIGQIPFGALSDYVAMVALAQIDPDADARDYDSILNLFAEASAPDRLTGWDRDYIKALYEAPRDRANASQQGRYIAGEMSRARVDRQDGEIAEEAERVSQP